MLNPGPYCFERAVPSEHVGCCNGRDRPNASSAPRPCASAYTRELDRHMGEPAILLQYHRRRKAGPWSGVAKIWPETVRRCQRSYLWHPELGRLVQAARCGRSRLHDLRPDPCQANIDSLVGEAGFRCFHVRPGSTRHIPVLAIDVWSVTVREESGQSPRS